VLADGFSCRTQLEQLSERTGLHLAQLLASQLPGRSPGRPDAPGGAAGGPPKTDSPLTDWSQT
jgi:hypothetical protein